MPPLCAARFSSIARDLRGPGLRAYFCPPAKVGKNGLRKLRFLRTFLNCGSDYLRYDLQITGLSSVQGTSLPVLTSAHSSYEGTGCRAQHGTEVWRLGC